MVDIIPAIIAKDFKELKNKIHYVEPYVRLVQVDVMDGKFVPNETFRDPIKLKKLNPKVNFEVHLMIKKPWLYLGKWLASGTKRIIIHHEAVPTKSLMKSMIEKTKKRNLEFAIAFNPNSNWKSLADLISKIDMVLFMTVEPGFYGKEFMPAVLPKIAKLRKNFPTIRIEVDGGINPETAKKLKNLNIDGLVAGSYILKAAKPSIAIKEIKQSYGKR